MFPARLMVQCKFLACIMGLKLSIYENVFTLIHCSETNYWEGVMAICIPIQDIKSTSNFIGLVEGKKDVTVTNNGCNAMHCLSNSEYEMLQQQCAKAKLLSRMLLAEQEIANNKVVDYDEFAKSIKAEYDL